MLFFLRKKSPTITNKKHFFKYFHFLRKIFRLQKIITYNWNGCKKIHPLRKKSIFGIYSENFFCFCLQRRSLLLRKY